MKAETIAAGKVAAFFDVDGTLLRFPSLERRFFRQLRYRRAIGFRQYLWWLCEAVRLLRRGTVAVRQENKMYLRGVAARPDTGWLRALEFWECGIQQIAWHAGQGHTIVLVSGTLDLLASQVAELLQQRLAKSGPDFRFLICATKLETRDQHWTGQIEGRAMVGEEKALAVRRIAKEMALNLPQCFAYGDSLQDQWMLQAVGNAVGVNPSAELRNVAELRGWRIVHWNLPREGMLSTALKKETAKPKHYQPERTENVNLESLR